ncbi:MAG TPA: SGNH/GDSL hydrolase family protein [Polyangiales bacterium]
MLLVALRRRMSHNAGVFDRIASLLRVACTPVFACSALGACALGPSTVLVAADDARIVYTGRFDTRNPKAPRGAWPGSQIAARFTGRFIRAVITDTPVEDESRETDWITVVIDDGRPKTFALAEGRHIYPLAQKLEHGEHHVLIWKRTEAEVGVLSFQGFQLDRDQALLEPSRPFTRHLELVGDSITAGYGDEGASSACHGSARVENNFLSYGAIAARELGASYSALAWSGKGLTRNYDPRDEEVFSAVYDRIIPTEPEAGSAAIETQPDAVIVNLGTNDFFAGMPDRQAVSGAYLQLLQTLRKRYPRALLVVGIGPLLADDYPQPNARSLLRAWLQAIVARWQTQVDNNIALIELWFDPREGVGCDFHPNVTTHARLGRELAELLRERLGWSNGKPGPGSVVHD